MIDPMLTLLVVPFLANNKQFNTSNLHQLIDIMDNLNDFSCYMNNRNNNYNSRRNNNKYRNYYRNGGKKNNVKRDNEYFDREIFRKIKDFLNELNGD
ncbi:hypothetical protein JYG23_12515 [Sedimentibacter sp. zth1]|uniref:hypothetical protein n=1 Tax=Sedimentibacter sp. zth1 TaxID=2816908 RepID=UPI001A921941|nr:hypothetical protein [Sedimentibacter sp. zth1]QSX05490.1 hypothetical protein JYG23_12515 [Sedimentibacter sp. zth1]